MESHHHQHDQHHSGADTDAAMAELLDLDAEVLHSYLSEVTAWIRRLAADPPPRRILDLGSGTGTGAFALLERFDQADVIALDLSAEMLHRLSSKARVLGVADRIRTVQADLDTAWPAIDAVDLVWASSSLHHMADPDRVLAGVFATLRPGGLLVVAEMASFPRFLPDDLGLGRPGLEARCHAVLDERQAVELPHRGSDWGPRLSRAGFTVEAERPFVIHLAHGSIGSGLGSLALRIGLPAVGYLAGECLQKANLGGVDSGAFGFVAGAVGAAAVDASVLGWDRWETRDGPGEVSVVALRAAY